MSQNNGNPVADPVYKFCRQKINEQLDSEIECDQHCDLAQWNMVAFFKCQKKQRHKVIYDCLHDVTHKTGIYRFLIFVFHQKSSSILL